MQEALAEEPTEEFHHLRVAGGDVEDKIVVREREVFRHHPLPLEFRSDRRENQIPKSPCSYI